MAFSASATLREPTKQELRRGEGSVPSPLACLKLRPGAGREGGREGFLLRDVISHFQPTFTGMVSLAFG